MQKLIPYIPYILVTVAVLAVLVGLGLIFFTSTYTQEGAAALGGAILAAEGARRVRAARMTQLDAIVDAQEDPAHIENELENKLAGVAADIDEVPLDELVARDPGARLK